MQTHSVHCVGNCTKNQPESSSVGEEVRPTSFFDPSSEVKFGILSVSDSFKCALQHWITFLSLVVCYSKKLLQHACPHPSAFLSFSFYPHIYEIDKIIELWFANIS